MKASGKIINNTGMESKLTVIKTFNMAIGSMDLFTIQFKKKIIYSK